MGELPRPEIGLLGDDELIAPYFRGKRRSHDTGCLEIAIAVEARSAGRGGLVDVICVVRSSSSSWPLLASEVDRPPGSSD